MTVPSKHSAEASASSGTAPSSPPAQGAATWSHVLSKTESIRIDPPELDEQVQRHHGKLAHSTRLHALGEMVASVVHELTQPLCAISNFAAACDHAIKSPSGANPQLLQEWIVGIMEEAQRSGKIIDRLRSYVRGVAPHRSTHEVRELIESAVDMVAMEARNRNTDLRIVSTCPATPVVVDAVQIQQVLVNLLRNGLDATEGCEKPQIHISAHGTADQVVIDITDNGRGTRGDLEEIFKPFVTSKDHGMGMGLAISRSIMNWHGGRIWATRQPASQGLIFHVLIPCHTKETACP